MTLEDNLFTVKYMPDTISHLVPDLECCKTCQTKVCTYICPAKVYEYDDTNNNLVVNYENCLECGACRIACSNIQWKYPKGTKGVTFKLG